MEKEIITEIVKFNIYDDIEREDFIETVNQLENEFHKKQPGYIDSELVNAKESEWVMVMHWATIEEVKNASRKLMKEAKTEKFRNALIPKTVKIQYLEQVKNWNKTNI